MFGSIIIRKSLPETAELDVGLIAECLIFYEKVHVIGDISMLRLLTSKIGLETIEELIKNNSFKLSFHHSSQGQELKLNLRLRNALIFVRS